MPNDEKPRLHLDQCQELKRLRDMAERLGEAMAGYLPGHAQDSSTGRPERENSRAISLEQAMARLDLQTESPGETE